MTKALLIIDYTNDFVADNGALTCGKPAQELEDYLVQLANRFYQNGDYVIFPTDAHCRDRFSPEAKLFPPHNVVGTPGQQLYGKVNDWFEQHQASDRVYQFNKNRYSSFQNTNLDNYLRERKIDNLWITGVCISVSCTPQLPPIIWTTRLRFRLRGSPPLLSMVRSGRLTILRIHWVRRWFNEFWLPAMK